MPPVADHPLRYALANELHARPYPALEAPCHVVFMAFKEPVDAANPRPNNLHGQIVRWREKGGRLDATEFTWEVFLLAGDKPSADTPDNLTGTINGDIFSSPDGLWFDPQGRLDVDDVACKHRVL